MKEVYRIEKTRMRGYFPLYTTIVYAVREGRKFIFEDGVVFIPRKELNKKGTFSSWPNQNREWNEYKVLEKIS